MKATNKTFQFPHATVLFSNDHSLATGQKMPKLYVQAIDQYRFQRELSVDFRHEPGNSSILFWESHVYQHPGRRHIVKLGKSQAEAFIIRFLELCEQYPSLLFNAEDSNRERHEGFVHLCERLHRGDMPSVNLL